MAKIDKLFKIMQERGASDLHLDVGSPPLLRSKGSLDALKANTLTQADMECLIFEIMTDDQREEYIEKNDVDFAYEIPDLARFRCNVFSQYYGMGAVFRIIPTEILTLDQLNVPQSVRNFANVKSGLILVTGPTGSGKSTTLSAIINEINTVREAHIITIEDPLEFVHPNKKCLVTQREVGAHTTSFQAALRFAARQDPDIVLVGEMRDLETISLAITCAEMGLLVFGTLHTNSASKTVDRIIDAFPADQQSQVRAMLAESLKGVVAQQLLKTKDGKGRCAAHEVLVGSSALGNMIREGKTFQIQSMIQTGKQQGMQTMDQTLIDLIKEDKITPEAAMEKAHDKELFRDLIEENG